MAHHLPVARNAPPLPSRRHNFLLRNDIERYNQCAGSARSWSGAGQVTPHGSIRPAAPLGTTSMVPRATAPAFTRDRTS
jgi:hypothetical protein